MPRTAHQTPTTIANQNNPLQPHAYAHRVGMGEWINQEESKQMTATNKPMCVNCYVNQQDHEDYLNCAECRDAERRQNATHAAYSIVNMLDPNCNCEDCEDIIGELNQAMEKLDDHLQRLGLAIV